MDWSEVQKLVAEGEGLLVDFKETRYLNSEPKEIAADLVAFANRRGGYILVGIKDDKSKEGNKIYSDKAQLRILEIANNNCSPPVELSFDFHNASDGDVLLIHINRMKDMPHAVVERSSAEIVKRTYYVRRGSSKRLVDDQTLRFLFHEKEFPDISKTTHITLWYAKRKETIKLKGHLSYYSNFMTFIDNARDISRSEQRESATRLFGYVFPYALLRSLSLSFGGSWLIEIERRPDSKSLRALRRDLPTDIIKAEDVPTLNQEPLASAGIDLKTLITRNIRPIHLPKDTKLQIITDGDDGELSLINPYFHIRLAFTFRFWGTGPPYLLDEYSEYEKNEQEDANCEFDLKLDASFDLLDAPDPMFQEHYAFAKMIEDMINHDWNFDLDIEKLKEERTERLYRKVSAILDILRGKK